MARLQILELPEVFVGEASETPYILVIDQVDDETAADIARWPDDIATRTGARHVLCFSETVDIPANDVASSAEDVEVSDADFTELASAVRRALGIDMTQVGVKPDIAGWLLAVCRELEKSEAARARLRDERAEQAADLERLRAGEEPVTDSRIAPTPAQWIWQWNRATPEKRLNMAAQILQSMAKANDCFMADHEAQIARLRANAEAPPTPDD